MCDTHIKLSKDFKFDISYGTIDTRTETILRNILEENNNEKYIRLYNWI